MSDAKGRMSLDENLLTCLSLNNQLTDDLVICSRSVQDIKRKKNHMRNYSQS